MSLWRHTRGSGADLVLLHGWGLSSAVWGEFADRLAERYRLTLIDLPGLGRSPVVGDMSPAAVVAALLEVAPASAHWLGWSLGGQLALALAQQAPERVRSLSLLAANPCFVARPDWPCAMASETFAAFVAALDEDPARTLQRFAALQSRGSSRARDELKLLRQVIAASTPQALAPTLQLLQLDLRPALAGLHCPVQLILGGQDPLVPAALAPAASALNPQLAVEVIEPSAHLPFVSHGETVLARLQALIRQRDAADATG